MVSSTGRSVPPEKGEGGALPRYVSHPSIRSPAAERLARAVVQAIEERSPESTLLTSENLFKALHACAWRAHRATDRRGGLTDEGQRWLSGWRTVRDHLLEKNLGLCYTMVSRFRSRDLDHEELIGEATVALARAIEHFNPWRGFRFSTYACYVISRALIRRIRLEARHRRLFPVQLEDMNAAIPPDHDRELYVERLQKVLESNRGRLTALESLIIAQRFPRHDQPPQTFQQIGQAVGLSKERVRQIHQMALNKLRETLRRDAALQ